MVDYGNLLMGILMEWCNFWKRNNWRLDGTSLKANFFGKGTHLILTLDSTIEVLNLN